MTPPLTVIVPVYNEERTVIDLLSRVALAPYPDKQVIVVDDGSTDGTQAALHSLPALPGFSVIRHPVNRGKGAAVRTGLSAAQGAVILIQDADLEYDPQEYARLVEPILSGESDAVYGSRYLGHGRPPPWTRFRVAVVLLNQLVRVLYGQRLTDHATCYKALRAELFFALDLRADRFEMCAEVTAKLCRRGVRILEVPVSYQPRSAAEGKKIGWRDAWAAVYTLVRCRLARASSANAANSLSDTSTCSSAPVRRVQRPLP